MNRMLNAWHREFNSRHQGIDGLPAVGKAAQLFGVVKHLPMFNT